jgi:hypothetical protein
VSNGYFVQSNSFEQSYLAIRLNSILQLWPDRDCFEPQLEDENSSNSLASSGKDLVYCLLPAGLSELYSSSASIA